MSRTLLSASQVSRFAPEHGGCERKWALRYIAKIPEPSTPAQDLGKDVDDNQLQPYLKSGRPFDFTRDSGYIAAAGLAYLPKPGTKGLQVQRRFELPSPTGGFAYLGFKDLWLPSGGMPDPPDGVEPDDVVVADFKTTKNFNWVKSPEALKTDVQAQLYATNAMWEMRQAGRLVERVHLVWLYFQTQGARKVKRTWLTVDMAHVFEQFSAIDAIGQKMVAIKVAAPGPELPREPDFESSDAKVAREYSLSLPPNPEACGAFGGCAYRHICNLSPAQYVESLQALVSPKRRLPTVPSTLDLFASLTAKKDGLEQEGIGINPPEQHLPPAPPVGSVEAAPKKRGRPKKAPADVVEVVDAVPDTAVPVEVLASTDHPAAPTVDVRAVASDIIIAATQFAEAIRNATKLLTGGV